MSDLVVVEYPDEYRAAEVLTALRRMNKEYLIDFEDACYVTKDARGKIKLHQTTSLAGAGAAWGGLWGMLIGLLFFVPFLGLALGAGMGAIAGKLSDFGIDDNFAKSVARGLQPKSSAIFVLVRKSTPEKVVPEISKYGGTVLRTSLPPDVEARLQDALNKGAADQLEKAQAVAETQPVPSGQVTTDAGTANTAQ